jgi:hypothetical protein
MKWWIWVVLGLCIMLSVGIGCSPTADTNGNGDGPIDRKTPDGLLNWLAVAYAEKDLEAYEEALHDEFLFVFTKDIADTLGLPEDEPWWGKTKDVSATGNMFNSSEVTRITMDYVPYGDRWVSNEELRDTTVYYGTSRRVIPDILVTIDKGLEPLNLVVQDSYLDVFVVRDPKFPNQVLYVFLKIEEIPQTPS